MTMRVHSWGRKITGTNPPRRISLRAGYATHHRIPQLRGEIPAHLRTGLLLGGEGLDARAGKPVGCIDGPARYRNKGVKGSLRDSLATRPVGQPAPRSGR